MSLDDKFDKMNEVELTRYRNREAIKCGVAGTLTATQLLGTAGVGLGLLVGGLVGANIEPEFFAEYDFPRMMTAMWTGMGGAYIGCIIGYAAAEIGGTAYSIKKGYNAVVAHLRLKEPSET